MKENETIEIIEAKQKGIDLGLKNLGQYKNLIFIFVKRDFSLMYKQTILGPLWLLLGPSITAFTYAIIFGRIAGMATDGVPHLLFYLAGVSFWVPFATCVNAICGNLQNNSFLFGKVYFPRLVSPISQAINFIINIGLMLFVTMAFYAYYYITGQVGLPSWRIVFILVFILQGALVAIGFGLIVTSLSVRYRDFGVAIGYMMSIWMFATPIVYSPSSLDGILKKLVFLNPMSPIICNFKYCLLGTGTFFVNEWILSIIVTIVLLFWGLYLYRVTERTFIDKV